MFYFVNVVTTHILESRNEPKNSCSLKKQKIRETCKATQAQIVDTSTTTFLRKIGILCSIGAQPVLVNEEQSKQKANVIPIIRVKSGKKHL